MFGLDEAGCSIAWAGTRRPKEEYNQSFVSYREVVKNNSRRCDIWHGLGNALLGLNRYEEALKAYDNATSAQSELRRGLV